MGGGGGFQPQQPQQSQAVTPIAPVQAGCYVWLPAGCPRQPHFAANEWKRDTWSNWKEEHAFKLDNQAVCEGERKLSFVGWCQTQDVRMLFVPEGSEAPLAPTSSGCFVLTNALCPSQPWYTAAGWNYNPFPGAAGKDGCVGERKDRFVRWCGASQVQALWLSPAPKQPGCYVTMPSGCPRNPHFMAPDWKKDSWPGWTDGRAPAEVADQKELCERGRSAKLNEWCGVADGSLIFVQPPAGQSIAQAMQPGAGAATSKVAADVGGW